MTTIKKYLLFAWYILGVIVSLPALVFIIISRWLGVQEENRALRELTKEDLDIHDQNKK